MSSSCLVAPASAQSGVLDSDLVRAGRGALGEYLNRVPDHRSRQGLRYELGFLLAVVVAAMAWAGHDDVAAIAQWVAEVPSRVLRALGAKPDPLTGQITAPSESTVRRTLAGVDADELQRLSTCWITATMTGSADHGPDGGGNGGRGEKGGGDAEAVEGDLEGHREQHERSAERGCGLSGVAIDGKSVRGAAAGGGPRPHLLGAATHDGSFVLAQRKIPDKGSEIHQLVPLVAGLDLAGGVVTMDALHTQRATAEHLVRVKQADYLMTVKSNQPSLLAAAAKMLSGPAADFAPEHIDHDRGHGRTEQRIVRAAPVTTESPLDFPHAAQVFRVIRHVGDLDGQRHSKEVAYCVTSPPPTRPVHATSAGCCAGTGEPSRSGFTRSATFRFGKTHQPCGPVPHRRPQRSSATPSSPRSASPDGPTSAKPADTSHTASADAST